MSLTADTTSGILARVLDLLAREAPPARFAELAKRWPADPPVPDFWGGFRVIPAEVEFWQGQDDRMHDRLRYRRRGEGWILERLAP